MKETEEGFMPIPEPTGAFLVRNGKGVQMPDGRYYHYSEVCQLLKLYHAEKLKSSLPSEQEIEDLANKKVGYIHDTVVTDTYKEGFKDALTLLTKGDK